MRTSFKVLHENFLASGGWCSTMTWMKILLCLVAVCVLVEADEFSDCMKSKRLELL